MLFNSYAFMFLFLPVALAGYQVAGRIHRKAVILWLGAISLAFYGWWQPWLLFLLVGSVVFNYVAAALIVRRIPNTISPRTWLITAVAVNLLLLGYYKYFFPSINSISATLGISKHWADVVLPLGISFFTFTQIAFLVDLYNKRAEQEDFPSYLLFVTFFPHLIAGPILHHREMMPQFHRERYCLNLSDITVGGTWFVLGLAKKVLIADTFADIANPVFFAHGGLTPGWAWLGSLAYAMQLYFDFSGYSDMALGLARMFSIDFPLNFNSPSKSTSFIENWQRWHMTLGRYVFTYIFIPLQRSIAQRQFRQGKRLTLEERAKAGNFIRLVALPLMFTMLVAGIWHGAGMQFVVFGLLHGIYLSINNAWRQFRRKPPVDAPLPGPIVRGFRHASCVVFVSFWAMISLIFFRAHSVGHALTVLAAMFGIHHAAGSSGLFVPPEVSIKRAIGTVLLGLLILWGMPNTQQILTRFKPSLQAAAWDQQNVPRLFTWAPSAGWALVVGVIFFVVLVGLQQPSTFLYFQF